jgi:hypothetical protein
MEVWLWTPVWKRHLSQRAQRGKKAGGHGVVVVSRNPFLVFERFNDFLFRMSKP